MKLFLRSLFALLFAGGTALFSEPGYIEQPYFSHTVTDGVERAGIFPVVIYFSENDTSVPAAGVASLRDAVASLSGPRFAYRFRITGYADTLGGETRNMSLGLRRAEAVARVLESLGAPMKGAVLASYGESVSSASREYRKVVVSLERSERQDSLPLYLLLLLSFLLLVAVIFFVLFSNRRARAY